MKEKPNVVLITVDQMRRDCMGVSGHPVVETPNLDMMKRFGHNITRAYCATPSCIPARASLLTGLTPQSHGRTGYKDGVPWDYKHTIASEFTNAGYQTQAIGKMHVFPERNLCGFHNVVLHDGYLHHSRNHDRLSRDSFAQSDDYLHWLKNELGASADLPDSGLECNSWVARSFPHAEKYHPTNWVVSESIDFLRRRDTTKPFFLFSSFVRPHSPLDPPQYYFDMYNNQELPRAQKGDWNDNNDIEQNGLNASTTKGIISDKALHRAKAAYYGHITHIDHQIGRLLQAMTEYNLINNTIFLFTSDHGDMLGDHNFFRKALPYEGSSGIPFVIYDPANLLGTKQNQTINTLAELRDIFPTLLDAAGIQIPETVEGKSLIPILKGNAAQIHEYIHGEHEFGQLSNQFIVTEQDKYIWFSQSGKEQYFDLLNDPQESHNLINDDTHTGRISLLRSHLIEELADRKEGYSNGTELFVGIAPLKILI